jgi:hypothetical protein
LPCGSLLSGGWQVSRPVLRKTLGRRGKHVKSDAWMDPFKI